MSTLSTLERVEQGFTYAGETRLKVMGCPTCGVTYAIPATLQANAQAAGHRQIVWYCPNGHELGYNGPSDAEKKAADAEARAREAERRALAERDLRYDTERRLSAQKGATTRAKNRHAAGLCPVCRRSFRQLRTHVAKMHPDFDPERSS